MSTQRPTLPDGPPDAAIGPGCLRAAGRERFARGVGRSRLGLNRQVRPYGSIREPGIARGVAGVMGDRADQAEFRRAATIGPQGQAVPVSPQRIPRRLRAAATGLPRAGSVFAARPAGRPRAEDQSRREEPEMDGCADRDGVWRNPRLCLQERADWPAACYELGASPSFGKGGGARCAAEWQRRDARTRIDREIVATRKSYRHETS